MKLYRDFSAKIGNVPIPLADDASLTDVSVSLSGLETRAVTEIGAAGPAAGPVPAPLPQFRICKTTLNEGCYALSFVPKFSTLFSRRFRGTMRVEDRGAGSIRFSGDLYSFIPIIIFDSPANVVSSSRVERLREAVREGAGSEISLTKVIPIYSRRSYYSYLKGVKANLTTLVPFFSPCSFSLDFDQYNYQHPATGFSGTFPVAPTRSIQFRLNYTGVPNSFSGSVYQGSTELGTVTITWISPKFRRATLAIYRLVGAENPPASVPAQGGSGTESFRTAFDTVGWDVSFSFVGDIPLPPALVGVQDPHQCWSMPNYATLMASIPGYNPNDLDTTWRAYLMAVPARIGCSRGFMFDTGSGDPNDIPREGAGTQCDDGYPAADSIHFGAAQGQMQKNVPRAFLRSACHEVGHTFNQIHQEFEGGSDNSIMTTTPSVADVLFAEGKSFPNDIHLGFNETVRRHLIHLPDPAVRPGAMDFFGAAVNAPQADQVSWPADTELTLAPQNPQFALGEALDLSWTLTNKGTQPVLAPSKLDIESLTARVSATNPTGQTTFLRPAEQDTCVHNPLKPLQPGQSLTGSTQVFWGRDGFTFDRPGRHIVDVVVIWQVGPQWVACSAETEVWVSFPVNEQDDRVASLLLHPDVGRAVASPNSIPSSLAEQRLREAAQNHGTHQAVQRLRTLGVHQRLGLP